MWWVDIFQKDLKCFMMYVPVDVIFIDKSLSFLKVESKD